MLKVVHEFSVGKYKVLKLSGEKPSTEYSSYVIDGKIYNIVPIYDAPNCIAIEAPEKAESFIEKTVNFQ